MGDAGAARLAGGPGPFLLRALEALRGGAYWLRTQSGWAEILHRFPENGRPEALVSLLGPVPWDSSWEGRVAKPRLYAFLLEGVVEGGVRGEPSPAFPPAGRLLGWVSIPSLSFAAQTVQPVASRGGRVLAGLHLEAQGREVWLAAYDGFRLHAARLRGEGTFRLTLPARVLWAFEALVRAEGEGRVRVAQAGEWVVLEGERVRAALRAARRRFGWRSLLQGRRLASSSFSPGARLLARLKAGREALLEAAEGRLALRVDGELLLRGKAHPAAFAALALHPTHLHQALERVSGACSLELVHLEGKGEAAAVRGKNVVALLGGAREGRPGERGGP